MIRDTAMTLQERYVFDEFEVNVSQRALLKDGQVVPLPSKVFQLLVVFLRHPGVELNKQALIRELWPDSFVEDSNLTQSIFLLRRALGQATNRRRLIVTIPGQGYVFTGNVEDPALTATPIQDELQTSAGLFTVPPSVAVLPFSIFDSSCETQYLGAGFADALINRLSHIEQIDVRPTGAGLSYADRTHTIRDIGRELGVNLLITGTVYIDRQAGATASRARVTVQLINARNGRLIWSDSVEHDPTQLLLLQAEIAKKVGHAIFSTITVQERRELTKRYTDNDEAYRDYLKGRYYAAQWTIRGWTKAIECFGKAVQRDPNYALAYCGTADAYYVASNLYSSPAEAMIRAKEAATRALAIDDSLAEAHTSAALVKGFFDWSWEEAEAGFRRAIALQPKSPAAHLWYGRLLATGGRFDEALDELRKSQRLDPLSPAVNAELGRVLYYARRFDDATEQLRETLELDPRFWPAHLFLGWVYEQQGHFTEAIAIMRRSSELDDNPRTRASLGAAYAFAGDEMEAERILVYLMKERKKRYVSPYYIALIHAALGNWARAFRYFSEAHRDRSEWLVWLAVDPRFDDLRQESRFVSLINQVGVHHSLDPDCAETPKRMALVPRRAVKF